MTTKKTLAPILSVIFIAISILFAFLLVKNIIELVTLDMHEFGINEIEIIEIPDSSSTTTMYFMFESYQNDLNYLIISEGNFTQVEMEVPGFYSSRATIEIVIENIETDEVLYIEPMPANTTASINDFEAIGKITFSPGTYSVTPTLSNGTMFLGSFGFADINIISFILLLVGSIFGLIIGITGFTISFTRYLKTRPNPITEYTSTNKQYDFDKNPYDEDDPFSEYN
jgi:hypothetical protein